MAKRVSFRTKGGKLVSFLAKGKTTRKKPKARRAKKMVKRRRRASRASPRRRSSGLGGGKLMRGLFPVRGVIAAALVGVAVATLQERFLPQAIPYQSVAAGFVVGGLPGAVGAFAKDMLAGGIAAPATVGVTGYSY